MLEYLVFAMLRTLIFPVKYAILLGPAKNTRPVKAGSHNLHYHISYICNMGRRDLPDMYTQARG